MPLSLIIFLKSDILPKIKTLIKKPFTQSSLGWHFPSPVCWLLCLAELWLQLLCYYWWAGEELRKEIQKRWWEEDIKRRGGLKATCAWVCVQQAGIQVQHTLCLCGMWLPTSVGDGNVWGRKVHSPTASGIYSQHCEHVTNLSWRKISLTCTSAFMWVYVYTEGKATRLIRRTNMHYWMNE